MKHIATIFLVLLFGSLTISSTTQELSDGKSLNDYGRTIRLKRNSKDDSLDEIMSLMETVQHAISVLATRQNELLQKIDGIETKVTDLILKQERTESNLQAKIADLIAKHDEFLPNIEQVTQNLEAKVAILPTKLETIQTKLSAIEAQIGRGEDALDTKMSSLNSTMMRKMESLKTELKASVINNGDIISREQNKLQLQAVQVEERLESMNFSLFYRVEKQNAANDRQLMSINSSLHFKLNEFNTDMHSAAMNATLFNTQILNSIEKLNNISLVLYQNVDAMNASNQDDRSKLTTQEISNLNLILVNESADDLLPLPSVLARKIAEGEIPYTNEWVVIQRRGTLLKHGGIREEFKDRNWGDYARGFGKIDADYWIGLEAIHLLNSARFTQLRVDLEDWEGNKAYAEYDTFALSAASDKYRISISGYSGNAGDSFAYHNGSQFSTKDQDHDTNSSTNYAARYGPWWWGINGGTCWLNAQYHNSYEDDIFLDGITWEWNGSSYALKKTEMKLRRRP